MTIREHITHAETDLTRQRQFSVGSQAYQAVTLSAIAHVLTAISLQLAEAERPAIPGLPPGYRLDTGQDPAGEHRWAYTVTTPDGRTMTTRHLWTAYAGALGAGLDVAREHAAGMAREHAAAKAAAASANSCEHGPGACPQGCGCRCATCMRQMKLSPAYPGGATDARSS
jgi:hypothetical protein